MSEKTKEKLKEWMDSLTIEQLKYALLETTTILIEYEEISLRDDKQKPYWSNCGDNIDGTEDEHEED
jgi:hypothetical protein